MLRYVTLQNVDLWTNCNAAGKCQPLPVALGTPIVLIVLG